MSYAALPTITEDLDELHQRLSAQRDPQLRERLHLLVLLKSERVSTRQEAAAHLARHRNTIGRWLTAYQQGGLQGLLHRQAMGKPPGQRTLPSPVLEALQARLATDTGWAGYAEVQHWLYDEFGLKVPYKTVHKIVRYDLKAKLKRARPQHPKKA
jgi:transposase